MGNLLWGDMIITIKFDLRMTSVLWYYYTLFLWGNIYVIMGINVIYVHCNVDVNKDCMFRKKMVTNSCPPEEGTPAM